jgi:hypothetical protein
MLNLLQQTRPFLNWHMDFMGPGHAMESPMASKWTNSTGVDQQSRAHLLARLRNRSRTESIDRAVP